FVHSVSAMQVHLLVNGALDEKARSTILHSTYDLEDAFLGLQRAETDFPAMVCTVLDHGDSERAPEGKRLVSLYTLSPYSRYDNWNVPFDARRSPDYRTMPDYLALRDQLGTAMIA